LAGWGVTDTPFDPSRLRPYKTGELARIFGRNQKTIIRWITDGLFGIEGVGWRWTPGGPGMGDREVFPDAVAARIGRNPLTSPTNGNTVQTDDADCTATDRRGAPLTHNGR